MTKRELVEAGSDQLDQIFRQLHLNLNALNREGVPDKIRQAVAFTQKELQTYEDEKAAGKLSKPLEAAQEISHIVDFLRLAVKQRTSALRYENRTALTEWIRRTFPRLFSLEKSESDLTNELNEIEELIQSCYEPFKPFLKKRPGFEKEPIPPEQILAIFFQGEYLSRPRGPVPFLIIPNYFEGNRPKEWMGVAHETGHHIYRQVPGLREELEVIFGRLLRDSLVTVNGEPTPITETQQRLWFNFLEETFADLVGVLTLGAAFVYTGQLMMCNYVSDTEMRGIGTRDLKHPQPLVRGRALYYMYEKLLNDPQNPDLQPLKQQWQEVTDALPARTLRDPHTPVVKYLMDQWNGGGELGYDETVAVMELVVDTLLNHRLQALDCKSLGEVLDFAKDEESRRSLINGKVPDKTFFDNLGLRAARIRVAARRLLKHRH